MQAWVDLSEPTTEKIQTDEDFWQAVVAKDKKQDGNFVYGVRTTGVYCRPSCAARLPRRENVTFYGESEQAQAAGLRACKRCRPDERHPADELAGQICRYIEENLDEDLSLEKLGAQLNSSPYHLQKVFKKVMGVTPRQYAEACRVRHFKSQLRAGREIAGAVYEAGFGSSSQIYERAAVQLGMTPAAYRKGGKGMTIRYNVVKCGLGYMLVAATEQGICAVSLADDPNDLYRELKAEYPKATFEEAGNSLDSWIIELLEHLNGRKSDLTLPIAVAYTPFQAQVWQELRRIPYGSTRSYGEVAQALGQPKAVRAVARACASNKVALLIPCHRVIREDGDLGGYRWGLERKRNLLRQEKEQIAARLE